MKTQHNKEKKKSVPMDFLNRFYLFIYLLFLAVSNLSCGLWDLFVAVRGLLSSCGLWDLFVAVRGLLSSCGLRAPECFAL